MAESEEQLPGLSAPVILNRGRTCAPLPLPGTSGNVWTDIFGCHKGGKGITGNQQLRPGVLLNVL